MTIEEALNIKWKSFDGNISTFGEMDHQHLSNIYHYTKHIDRYQNINKEEILKNVKMVLDHRFGGELLEYVPVKKFAYEMELLEKSKLLREDGRIIKTGMLIGKI